MKTDDIQQDIDALLAKIAEKVNLTGDGNAAPISLCVAIERLTTALGSAMQSNFEMRDTGQTPEVSYKANILPRYLLAFRLGVKSAEIDPSIVRVQVRPCGPRGPDGPMAPADPIKRDFRDIEKETS